VHELTICVFGGTGFIGRHLCQELHAKGIGACVVSRNPDRQFLSIYAPSVTALTIDGPELPMALESATVLVYLASSSRPASNPLDPSHELDQAAQAAALMTKLRAINPNCHVVFASSGGQIYGRGYDSPIPETTPPSPPTAYALGKLLVENMLAFFAQTDQLGVTVLRIANPVGHWQFDKGHGLVAAAIRSISLRQRLTIFGDGRNMRDYFDVEQLAQLLARFDDPSFRPHGVFNIGSGHGMTERDVIAVLEALTGRQLDVAFAPARPFDLRYAVLDVDRARAQLGWNPEVDLSKTVFKILSQGRR
jgi:UDP-glucose 4-epimerase